MKTVSAILTALAVVATAFAQNQDIEKKQLYTCAMHPEVVRAETRTMPEMRDDACPVKGRGGSPNRPRAIE